VSASASGTIVYRSGLVEGERQFVWVDRSGKELRQSGPKWASGISLDLSRDERFVAFDQLIRGSTDIWVLDLNREVATQFTANPEFEVFAVWSPDGTRIAFMSNRKAPSGSTFDIYVKNVNGKQDELLVSEPASQMPSDWSRDGRYLLYTDSASGVGAMDMDGGGKRLPTVQSTAETHSCPRTEDGSPTHPTTQGSGSRSSSSGSPVVKAVRRCLQPAARRCAGEAMAASSSISRQTTG
jgi:hypothetical protein